MVPGRRYTVTSVARLLWKRRWVVALPLAIFLGGAVAFSTSLPNLYQSQTLIMLVPQRVPEDFVRTTVTTRLEDRLRTTREQILTRMRLEDMIKEYNLFPGASSGGMMVEQVVERMRGQVTVTPVRDTSFSLAFTYSDPELAAKVTERLASMFIDELVRDRSVQADNTSEFLEQQLNEAKAGLVAHDKRLEEYRIRHSGALPSQLGSNLQMIQSTQQQLTIISDATNRLRDRRVVVEQQVQDQRALIAARVAAPVVVAAAPTGEAAPAVAGGSATQRLETARGTLDTLRQRLRDDHPDVARVLRQIAELEPQAQAEAQAAAAAAAEPAAARPVQMSPNPAIAQAQTQLRNLEAQLVTIDNQLTNNDTEAARLRGVLDAYQARLEQLPTRESELTELTRDYTILQARYNDLLTKREDAKLSASLEKRQAGDYFRVADPARVPEVPISPNRMIINGLGAVVGLLLGLGTAVLRELLDTTLRSDVELGASLGLPTLAMVPLVATVVAQRQRRKRVLVEAALVALVAVGGAGVLMWWRLSSGS